MDEQASNYQSRSAATSVPTPLWAVNALTFLASVGTGVVWAGIGFIAKHEYGYGMKQTLTLYLVMSLLYVIIALKAGAALRAVERWVSARTIIALILLIGAVACIGPIFIRGDWMLWVVACTINAAAAWLWPIVESYLTAARHGAQMRRAIGWWNVCWTSAVAFSLLAIAPLIEEHARLSFALVGALNLIAIFTLLKFPRWPAAHDAGASLAAIGPEYPHLLRTARTLLPLSYLLNSAMMPLLPFLLGKLEVVAFWETPAAATWTIVRILAMAIMWRLGFWHGRWGTLLLGGLSMTIGFAMVVLNISLPITLIGLGVYGAGMGIVYYAALYYAMSVGHAEVEAGGTHEALIGAGYAAGPTAGFIGLYVSEYAAARGMNLWDGAGVVAIACAVTGACSIIALRPYLRARRARRDQEMEPQMNADERR